MKKPKKNKPILNPEVVPSTNPKSIQTLETKKPQDEIVIDDDEVIEQSFIPVVGHKVENHKASSLPARTTGTTLKSIDSLDLYIKEISRYELLTPEEEHKLTSELVQTGDIEVAKKLVRANLRLVVKIALEYRHAYQNILDLIQEGNIGLMKAVSKYDPSKGAKLSYYASWWIKSYILKFILDNFRLVKVGTTADQKKLFYNLMREKERLLQMGLSPDTKLLAEKLDVPEKAVIEMENRLHPMSGEVSLDKRPTEDSKDTLGDLMSTDEQGIDDKLADEQGLQLLQEHLESFLSTLKDRDREIFTKRLLSEIPESLQSIANEYGVSRERIRQVEERLIQKLKIYMADFIR